MAKRLIRGIRKGPCPCCPGCTICNRITPASTTPVYAVTAGVTTARSRYPAAYDQLFALPPGGASVAGGPPAEYPLLSPIVNGTFLLNHPDYPPQPPIYDPNDYGIRSALVTGASGGVNPVGVYGGPVIDVGQCNGTSSGTPTAAALAAAKAIIDFDGDGGVYSASAPDPWPAILAFGPNRRSSLDSGPCCVISVDERLNLYVACPGFRPAGYGTDYVQFFYAQYVMVLSISTTRPVVGGSGGIFAYTNMYRTFFGGIAAFPVVGSFPCDPLFSITLDCATVGDAAYWASLTPSPGISNGVYAEQFVTTGAPVVQTDSRSYLPVPLEGTLTFRE